MGEDLILYNGHKVNAKSFDGSPHGYKCPVCGLRFFKSNLDTYYISFYNFNKPIKNITGINVSFIEAMNCNEFILYNLLS